MTIRKIECWVFRAPIATPVKASFGSLTNRPAVFLPKADVLKVQQAVMRALANPELKTRLEGQGANVPGLGATAYGEMVSKEIVRWNGVVKAAGIKPE